MKRSERLSKLLIILSIAVLWSYLMGVVNSKLKVHQMAE